MSNLVENPFRIFTTADGLPLEDGYIFIGEAGLSPITNAKQAYWDSDLSVPANDIRTKGGYPVNNSNPGRLYVDGNYSILVQDKRKATIYTKLNAVDYSTSISSGSMNTVDTIADLREFTPVETNVQCSVIGNATAGDHEVGPIYYWDATSVEGDNGASIIKPTDVSGAGRWKWANYNAPLVEESISVSQAVSLDWQNKVFVCNASSDIELITPDGDFTGQEVQVINLGARAVSLTGTETVDFTALVAADYYINAAVDGGDAADLEIGSIDSSSLTNAIASLNSTAVVAAGLDFSATGTVDAATVVLSTLSEEATSEITMGTATLGTDLATTLGLSGATGTRTVEITGSSISENFFVSEYAKTTWANDTWAISAQSNQDLRTTDAATFKTVNTGQGNNELYPMDQGVRSTDDVRFNHLQFNSGYIHASGPTMESVFEAFKDQTVVSGVYLINGAYSLAVALVDYSVRMSVFSHLVRTSETEMTIYYTSIYSIFSGISSPVAQASVGNVVITDGDSGTLAGEWSLALGPRIG